MKRVFIVHGWDGNPKNHWFPVVRKELESKGFKTYAPAMPHPEAPKIGPWVATLKKSVGAVDNDTYFIGHSCGCQAIIRYLGTQRRQCGGAVFVGGWFTLTPEATPDAESRKVAKPWLLSPIPFDEAKAVMPSAVVILSDDDPYVPLASNAAVFKKTLNARVITQQKKGHFEIKTLPAVTKEIVAMARK
jgi:serine hydrolase